MFGHIFIYQLKKGLRSPVTIGWTLLFPIVLGTLFYVAFSHIYGDSAISTIPVAVVMDSLSESEAEQLTDMLSQLEISEDTPMLDPIYTDTEQAEELLEAEEIIGIITAESEGNLKLQVRENGIEASILGSLISQYNQKAKLLQNISEDHPEYLAAVVEQLSADTSYVLDEQMTEGNRDPYVAYFYNLITMVCLFAALVGLNISTDSQANLSAVGARVNVAPLRKLQTEMPAFLALLLVQLLVVYAALFYLLVVLRIHFGDEVPYIFFTASLGTCYGMALGFLIGHIGTASLHTKQNILSGVTLVCCFLSGLMFGQMKILVQEHCPIVNKINPAAVLTDAFYTLNIYGVGNRYFNDLILIAAESLVFLVLGLVLARRCRYASV
jgi:ABC-2 type transport system permease protein